MKKERLWQVPAEFRGGLVLDGIGFTVLFAVSMALGLILNAVRDKSLSLVYQSKQTRMEQAVMRIQETGRIKQASKEPLPGKLSLDEFKAFALDRKGLVLDARPEIFYRFGHVPGALSIPRDDFERAYSQHRQQLETGKGQPLAIYCSNTSCEDSELVRKALVTLGYVNVSIYAGGWAEWSKAGLPEEKQ